MPSESYEEAYDYENDEALEDYNDESFEYDESYSEDDDDDEDFEDDDDDEAFEDDDDDESFEDDDDDEDFEDDDDDESFEDDDDDEAFEDDDDDEDYDDEDYDDEGAEATGEASEAIAAENRRRRRRRARARMARARRARLARARRARIRRARARQRAAARRARANRNRLSRRFRRIGLNSARRTRARRLRPVKGSAIVVATLPNGRRTRMRISPAPASARSVNALRRQIGVNNRRHAKAARMNAKAIKKLTSAQSAAVKKLTAQQIKADKALSKRIVAGDNKLDKRISKEFAKSRAMQRKHRRQMMMAMKRQRRRSLWNNILVTSAMPFFAAYGDTDNPFSRDNLILTASLAGWLVGDELLDGLVRRRGGKSRNMRTLSRGSDLWSYVAPVGNAATVWFLLKDRQHERFISGNTNVTFNTADGDSTTLVGRISIRREVAEDSRDDFAEITNVRAVITPTAPFTVPAAADGGGTTPVPVGALSARVVHEDSESYLEITAANPGVNNATGIGNIAWVVDTKDPSDD